METCINHPDRIGEFNSIFGEGLKCNGCAQHEHEDALSQRGPVTKVSFTVYVS
jgi:hypothetical protein